MKKIKMRNIISRDDLEKFLSSKIGKPFKNSLIISNSVFEPNLTILNSEAHLRFYADRTINIVDCRKNQECKILKKAIRAFIAYEKNIKTKVLKILFKLF